MGPLASAEFLKILTEKFPAHRDQDHPKIIYLCDPQIPDRSAAILQSQEDPTTRLKSDLLKLVEWGSEILAVPCNTAHYFIENFREELPVPLISIIDASVNLAKKRSRQGAWLLSTKATWKSGTYEKVARTRNYPLFLPSLIIMDKIQKAIYLVKSGDVGGSAKILDKVLKELWEEKDVPFIAACTELPLAYARTKHEKSKMVSSLEALALACIEKIH